MSLTAWPFQRRPVWAGWCFLALLFTVTASPDEPSDPAGKQDAAGPGSRSDVARERVPGEELFARPTLVDIRLKVSLDAQASLRAEPRAWVEADVSVDGREMPRVGIHLKSMTSFLPLDRKPSFTLSFNRHIAHQRLFGLRKIHLNNSVQNPSYLNEDLAGELFRRAGVPCARAAWAKVRLNERDLGLYVLKEAFSREFLGLHFPRTDGNFYDGGLHHEIDEPLVLDSGDGPQDRSDLQALYAAAVNPDLSARWQQLQARLDMGRFVSMMAMEALTCHLDGYSLMQNNYRIYFNPTTGRAVFVAHGLDRMFERMDFPVEPAMVGRVARAVLEVPEGRRLYRQRLADLAEKVFDPAWMTNRMDSAIQLLKTTEPLVEPEGNAVRQRVLERVAFVRKSLGQPPFKLP
jgi:spore coat protein H